MTSAPDNGAGWLAALGPLPFDSATLELRLDEPMSRHTTLRLGGPADLWVMPRTSEALQLALQFFNGAGVPLTFVGGGTNLLVRDGGIRGAVINLGHLQAIEVIKPDDPAFLRVEAGVHTSKLLHYTVQRSLQGLEFLAGVPGSVGGGLRMNAGTYLGEFTQVVTEVRSLTHAGQWVVRNHDECGFVYRGSALPDCEIVVDCHLQLQKGDTAEMTRKIEELRSRKRDREPKGVPNNGSTFKNPPGEFAGRLIEAAGLKGYRVGGAQVSPVHANWLVVAQAGCTSADLLALIDHVREAVLQHCGIHLQLEVKVVGEPTAKPAPVA